MVIPMGIEMWVSASLVTRNLDIAKSVGWMVTEPLGGWSQCWWVVLNARRHKYFTRPLLSLADSSGSFFLFRISLVAIRRSSFPLWAAVARGPSLTYPHKLSQLLRRSSSRLSTTSNYR